MIFTSSPLWLAVDSGLHNEDYLQVLICVLFDCTAFVVSGKVGVS